MKKQVVNKGVLGIFVWGLVACSAVPAAPRPGVWTPELLSGTRWDDVDAVPGQVSVSLEIAKDARMSGHAGCNRYLGKAELSAQALRLVPGGVTNMFCFPPESMDSERRFLAALTQTRSARREQGLLLLLDESGKVLWRFKPRP